MELLWAVIVFFAVTFYFLPTIIAKSRGVSAPGLVITNVLFGWTILGWLAALLWALIERPELAVVGQPAPLVTAKPSSSAVPLNP